MARRPTPQQRLEKLLAEFEPIIRKAFRAAIRDLASNAEIGQVADMLAKGDIEGALRALHIDPAAFRGLDEAIRQTYIAGGSSAAATVPAVTQLDGTRLVMRFDARSPRAERWLAEHSSTLITNIVEDQRGMVRTALREGMERGRNPRSVALDIAGRINPATGRREGGLLGLTSGQERAVSKAKDELLSGDRTQLRNYLTRGRRDKRFDTYVRKAIKDGKPVPSNIVSRMTGRYADRQLQLRAETIARTEAIASLNRSQVDAFGQAIDSGAINRGDVRKVWKATRDARTRDSHRHLDGESVGYDERFANGLLYPGEPGGPAAEVINCRCTLLLRVDFLANLS